MIVPRYRAMRNRRKRGAKVLPLPQGIVPRRADCVENRPLAPRARFRLVIGRLDRSIHGW